jgi:hypothetical protein
MREAMERAVVSRGRTVCVPDPSVTVFTGREPDGEHKERFAPGLREIGPGNEVELPRSEVLRLRKLGFLVDPDAAEIPTAEGPSYQEMSRR